MESSSPSGKLPEQPPHRWASLFGTAIAILTLTLPIVLIASFSSQSDADHSSARSIVPDYSLEISKGR